MWCDVHAVRRRERKGSSSDHCRGQEVTAGTKGALGTPWGWAWCFGYWPAFPLADELIRDQHASFWLASPSGWPKENPRFLGTLRILLLAFNSIKWLSICHLCTKDGPTCKTKALVLRDSISANFSFETWTVNFLWLRVLWLLELEANTQSAQVAWLAEFLMWMLQSWLVADWAIYWECTFQNNRGSRNYLGI